MKGFGDMALGTGCVVAFIVTLLILHASKTQALGQTEEGILYGLGIYKIYDVITEDDPWQPGQSSNGYGDQFPPFRCKGSGIECAYQRGVYEREKVEWEDAREKAYECGRYGRNCEQ